MIRDLESLLLTIPEPASREYVREALACYSAGAYRAAVVLSVAAGMDNLREKLATVAASGGAEAATKTAHQEIEKRFNAQEAFENGLIDAAEKATILSPAEANKLRVVLKTRHLCAHPSGHRGTAEEARDAITSVVDLILARPALIGMAGVTTLVDRLSGPNFFPNPKLAASVDATVRQEVSILNPALFNALTSRLVRELVEHGAQRAAKTTPGASKVRSGPHLNVLQFLRGLLRLGGDARAAVWRYMSKLIEDPHAVKDTLLLLSTDPAGLSLTDRLVRDRALSLVRRNLAEAPALTALRRWLAGGMLSDAEQDELYDAALRTLLKDAAIDLEKANAVLELGWPRLGLALFEKLAEGANAFQWEVANACIQTMQSLDPDVASRVPGEVRVQYLLNVASRAHGQYAAHTAVDIRDHGLAERTDFIDALLAEAAAEPDRLRGQFTNWLELAKIVEASGREDALHVLIGLFRDPSEETLHAADMLRYLAGHADGNISSRAAEASRRFREWLTEP